jgi:hypothetical protein
VNITSPQAMNTIIRYATEDIEQRPASEQAEIYDALASLLPTREEQIRAGRVAFAIRETSKLQLEFTRLLTRNSK